MARKAKKAVKKSAKKSTAKKGAVKFKASGEGYKGHRVGTAKEQLHQMFDKLGPEKARAEALKKKIAAVNTINTSFSQFRTAA